MVKKTQHNDLNSTGMKGGPSHNIYIYISIVSLFYPTDHRIYLRGITNNHITGIVIMDVTINHRYNVVHSNSTTGHVRAGAPLVFMALVLRTLAVFIRLPTSEVSRETVLRQHKVFWSVCVCKIH